MDSIISGPTGLLHFLASLVSLVTGIYVLIARKGDASHRKVGYVYAVSMLVLNITAFLIYNLYGKFGIFHWFAIVSFLTLFAGMVPVLLKRPYDYLLLHFKFMYWSVIGLYCALMAEVFSRLPFIFPDELGNPSKVFYKFVGIGTIVVMVIGILFFIKKKPIWTRQYKQST